MSRFKAEKNTSNHGESREARGNDTLHMSGWTISSPKGLGFETIVRVTLFHEEMANKMQARECIWCIWGI